MSTSPAAKAIHASDADGGEKTADGCGNKADEKRNENEEILRRGRINCERLKRDDSKKKKKRQAGKENVERNFVGSFLTFGAFDEANHAIEKGLAGIRGDPYLDFVGKHTSAAGNGRAIAARFANYGSRFSGDGGLVHGGDAFDDFAVARNHFSGRDQDDVAGLELRAWDLFFLAGFADAASKSFRTRLTERFGLRFAAAFCHSLRKIGEEDGKPEPERDLEAEIEALRMDSHAVNEINRRDERSDFDDEHDRVLVKNARIELDERFEDGTANQRGKFGLLGCGFGWICHGVRRASPPTFGDVRGSARDSGPGKMSERRR